MSNSLQALERQGLIQGHKVARGALVISHLFFVDDSYLFFGKIHFKILVFLLFSIFRFYTFILRHCILVLLILYRFRPSIRAR